MYHVSVGAMKMRGWRVFFKVIRMTYRALRAARAADGCVHADIFRDGRRYYAMSVWSDAEAMKRFAHEGVHGELMRQIDGLMSEFKNINYPSDTIPSRAEAKATWEEQSL